MIGNRKNGRSLLGRLERYKTENFFFLAVVPRRKRRRRKGLSFTLLYSFRKKQTDLANVITVFCRTPFSLFARRLIALVIQDFD